MRKVNLIKFFLVSSLAFTGFFTLNSFNNVKIAAAKEEKDVDLSLTKNQITMWYTANADVIKYIKSNFKKEKHKEYIEDLDEKIKLFLSCKRTLLNKIESLERKYSERRKKETEKVLDEFVSTGKSVQRFYMKFLKKWSYGRELSFFEAFEKFLEQCETISQDFNDSIDNMEKEDKDSKDVDLYSVKDQVTMLYTVNADVIKYIKSKFKDEIENGDHAEFFQKLDYKVKLFLSCKRPLLGKIRNLEYNRSKRRAESVRKALYEFCETGKIIKRNYMSFLKENASKDFSDFLTKFGDLIDKCGEIVKEFDSCMEK